MAKKPSRNTIAVTVYLSPFLLEKIEALVKAGFYVNRTELVREAVRKLIRERERELAAYLRRRGS